MRVTSWWVGWVLAAGSVGLAPAAEEKGKPTVQTIEYGGWKHNLRLGNGDAELVVTLDVGPRVLSYRLAGGKNVFKEYADQLGGVGEADWMIRGGHRLWAAPEDTTRTYAPDNGPVSYQQVSPGIVRFTPAPEKAYGLRKELEIGLAPSGSRVTVTHRIVNVGRQATRLAPWALSVMAPGGTEVIPLPPKRPHPGSPKNARSAADFAPGLVLVAWPFTDFQDPRWHFGSRFITLRQDAARGATKLGLAHKEGAVGYLNSGTLFVKRFGHDDGKTYPDGGVNFETFTNEDMLEIESLGPLVDLAPGESVEHVERWELFGAVGEAATAAEIEAKVGPRLR